MPTNLPSTKQSGQAYTLAEDNSTPLALNGMGILSDNDGFPILGNSFIPGLSLLLGQSGESVKAFAGAGTYTVPAGKWFYITNYFHAAVVATDSITPSGGSAFTIAAAGTAANNSVELLLGPGDAITLGNAGSYLSGTLFNAPAGVTRILQTVSSTVTLAVPALRRILLTAAVSTVPLQIDGINAAFLNTFDSATAGQQNIFRRLLVNAGQVIASGSATLILINGVQYVTAS